MAYFVSQLEQTVRAEGNVETWLMSLMSEAQESLHGVIRFAYNTIYDPQFTLLDFLETFPAQVSGVNAMTAVQCRHTL